MWLCIAKKSISASSVGMSLSPPAHITATILRIDRCQGFTLAPLTRYSSRPATDIAAGSKNWSDARAAEGAPLLREYRVKSSIEGSNPSRSASVLNARKSLICGRFYLCYAFVDKAVLVESVVWRCDAERRRILGSVGAR
ncbi:hypothetical protein XAC3607_1170050 [Xanthomonas citri pv. citri]|nr:hypothetical protein XAC3607_1170050 [Xanthomonas citri pv. citri]CEL44306.1 hypothetical protein XAC439_4270006 [Xanthomonas citri pv. citri]CEL51293.1 hypothetical protein XACJM35_810050 [Xanthomonas citri pv. citri]